MTEDYNQKWHKWITCKACGREYYGHCNSRYCSDCPAKDYDSSSTQRYRARKLGLTEHFTYDEWQTLRDCYGNECLSCGQSDIVLHADHIVPLARGGWNTIDNIQPLCKSCNSKKVDKTIDYRPFILDWELWNKAKEKAESEGMTISEVIRLLLSGYVKNAIEIQKLVRQVDETDEDSDNE